MSGKNKIKRVEQTQPEQVEKVKETTPDPEPKPKQTRAKKAK